MISQVSKEKRVYTEDGLINQSKSRPEWVKDLYFTIRERIMTLGDVEIKPNGNYISFRKKRPFTDIVIYNKGLYIILNIKSGKINDPNSLTKDISPPWTLR